MRITIAETLTTTQKLNILSGNSDGIFPYVATEFSSIYSYLPALSFGYYFDYSQDKIVSKLFENVADYLETEITDSSVASVIGEYIGNKFLDKWERALETLTEEYDPIYNRQEVETYTTNSNNTKSYDLTTDDNGKRSFKETIGKVSNDDSKISGFNSVNPVNSNTTDINENETREGSDTDNTNFNRNTKTGTERITDVRNENRTVNGKTTTSAENIEKELDMRAKEILFNIIFKDIDSVIALGVI